MAFPTIADMADRVKLTDMLLNTAGSSPAASDVISGYGTAPSGYGSIYTLQYLKVYPINVINEATGDWFSCFGSVYPDSGTFTIVSVDDGNNRWTSGQAVNVPVTVTVSLTSQYLATIMPSSVEVSGTSYTITNADNYKILRFTSGSAVLVAVSTTFGEYLSPPSRFKCWLVQEGAGTVTVDSAGLTTLNGATSDVALSAPWKLATLYPTSSYAHIALVE